MADIPNVIERYFEFWNERDQERRRLLIGQIWSDDASLIGPLFRADGADGIDGIAAGIQEHFSEHEFRMVGVPNAHNDAVRFGWELVPTTGESAVAAGVDFGRLTTDGRIRSIVSFVDLFPAGVGDHG